MHETIILLLAIVVASSILERVLPLAVLLPIIQVGLGCLLAPLANIRLAIDPAVFLLLFIAPNLFLDAWRIPKSGLAADKWTIAALALGLVIVTVVGAGLFINWMIPAIPLAVAFALAAVLSPTDAVGVTSIAKGHPIPKRLLLILEGESLLNDASGLVCFRFAVAAALMGTFSIVEASLMLLWVGIGGIAAGAIVALLANAVKDWVARKFREETGNQILISLLIPFGAYLLAEHWGTSGILAAVAAGVVMSYEEQSGRALAPTRIQRAAVWDTVRFISNGVIFVLLGLQLPGVVEGAGKALDEAGRESAYWLLAYVLAIGGVLITLRALWAWATFLLIRLRSKEGKSSAPGWRLVAVTSFCGVRGALTLSGIMTLPLTTLDGAPFPARELAIVLAAGVILLSLLGATIALPYLLRGLTVPSETWRQQEEDDARIAAAEAAIRVIERSLRDLDLTADEAAAHMQAGAQALAAYRQRVDNAPKGEDDRVLAALECKFRLVALGAERKELYRRAGAGLLAQEIARDLVREIDLQEARFAVAP